MSRLIDIDPYGVKWMGPIPSSWSTAPTKRHFDIQLGKMLQNNPASTTDKAVPYLKALHVLWGIVNIEDLPEMWANSSEIRQYGVRNGDLLVCEGGEAGRAGIVDNPPDNCIIQNALHRVRPKNSGDLRFLMYILHAVSSAGWLGVLCNKATIAHFTREKFADLRIPIPKTDEQRAIAAFLDRETARIDTLIEKKERQIELLQEKRSALISHVVTKGLDPNVKMKDSGIEWLGEIPEHWEVLAIKRVTSIPVTDGPHETPELLDEGIPFISAEAIKNDRIDFSKMRGFISPEEHARFSKKYKPKRGDIFLIKSGATTGNVAFVDTDEEFNVWSPLAVIRPHPHKATTPFVFFFMKSRNFFQSIELGWSYGTQQNIGMNVIENIPIVRPPIEEQKAIGEFLVAETSKVDEAVSKIGNSIDLLREYRTALITAAVTGKIDVRGAC